MRRVSAATLVVGLVALVGCGGSADLVSVSGVVMLDGTPMANANISFIPEDQAGLVANGQTDDDGRFRMKSNGMDDGVRPGSYKVTVEGFEERRTASRGMGDVLAEKFGKGGDAAAKDVNAAAKGAYKEMVKQGAAKKGRVAPAVYADSMKTPLRAKVPSSEYKFELTKDGK